MESGPSLALAIAGPNRCPDKAVAKRGRHSFPIIPRGVGSVPSLTLAIIGPNQCLDGVVAKKGRLSFPIIPRGVGSVPSLTLGIIGPNKVSLKEKKRKERKMLQRAHHKC